MLGSKISDEPFLDRRAIYSLRVDFSFGLRVILRKEYFLRSCSTVGVKKGGNQ